MKHSRLLLLYLSLVLVLSAFASAHVGYVLDDQTMEQNKGANLTFLLSALQDPLNIGLIIGTLVVVVILVLLLYKNTTFRSYTTRIVKRSEEYKELVPWMARLGVGIALIGAGSANVLISPSLEGFMRFSTVQIALGFLILAGFLLGPALWAALLLYLYSLSQSFYLLGNLDLFTLCIGVLVFGLARPGVDDLFGLRFRLTLKHAKKYAPTIIRAGIGFAMVYLAIYEKLLNPLRSAAVVDLYGLTSAIPVSSAMWVLSAGLIECAVGLALLIGFHTRLFSAIAFLVLSASFFYFNEAVYSHITLFATLSILFVIGGGPLSVDSWWKKRTGSSSKRVK